VVEIAKALSLRSDILVMDEPTAALTGREVDRLFEVIRSLRRSGVSVIYISHRLQEIKQVADRVTVLRDGRRIVTAPVEGITVDEIVRHMVGRALTEQYPKDRVEAARRSSGSRGSRSAACAPTCPSRCGGARSSGWPVSSAPAAPKSWSSSTAPNGETPADLRGRAGGEHPVHPRRGIPGIALIPEERKKQGLVLGLSVLDNVALAILDLHSTAGFIRRREITALVTQVTNAVRVKTPSLGQLVRNLSGGNQQKVVLSKWFVRNCDVYIFDEPTRGIDVGREGRDLPPHAGACRQGSRHHHGFPPS